MVDVKKEIRRAVDSGKVLFGLRLAEKNLLKGSAQLLIISESIPGLAREKIENQARLAEVPFYVFSGSGHELGAVCGKPFVVSALLVKDAGKSKLLSEVLKESKPRKTVKREKKK